MTTHDRDATPSPRTNRDEPLDRKATPPRPSNESSAVHLLRAEAKAVAGLAAGLAYELEEPTSRLLVRLRAMCELGEGDGADRDSLARAVEAAERIESTVRRLGAFNSSADAPHGVDVHEAVELALHLATPELAGRATVRRAYEPVKRVRGSLGRLVQVLLAVLRNAAASIPRGGQDENAVFVHTGLTAEGRVTIDIVDTGAGIEPADLEYIFDPFFTTKPVPEAVGLGLAAARAAILEMGGTIEVESIVGHGSRFELELVPVESSERSVYSCVTCGLHPERRVLCVGRSATDAAQIGDLVDDGHTRLVFATVEDAISRLATGESYDLVLCERVAAHDGSFQERVARIAPNTGARSFTVPLRVSRSGLFERPEAPQHVASGGE